MPRSILPKNMLGRSLLILIVPMILVQLVSHFVFLDRHLDSVTKLLAGNILNMTQTLLMLQQNPKITKKEIQKVAEDYYSLEYNFTTRQKKLVKVTPPDSWAEEYLIHQLDKKLGYPYTLVYNDQHLMISVEIPGGIATVRILRKRLMSKTTQLVFYWAIGTSLLALIIAALFMRNQLKPLRQLTEKTEEFGKGRDTPDFNPHGATEIRRVAVAFNVMKNRIKRQVTQRTDMLAGISHDLRTPLTRMKLELAMLPDSETATELRRDVDEMENMVNEYLDFVRQDVAEKIQTIDLSEVIGGLADRLQTEAIQIRTVILPKKFLMMVRPNAFKRCLNNVLINASRYGTEIEVRAKKDERYATIYIDDNGVGIPPEKRQDVFKAFYRIEGSRNPETGGIGLGLNIVQDIIHSHGGRVELTDAPVGGLRVILRVPL